MFCAIESVTRWSRSDCWRSSRNCWSRSERTASHASTRLGRMTASTKTSATFFICVLREISQVHAHNQAQFDDSSGERFDKNSMSCLECIDARFIGFEKTVVEKLVLFALGE